MAHTIPRRRKEVHEKIFDKSIIRSEKLGIYYEELNTTWFCILASSFCFPQGPQKVKK